jgi:hypothetical protein
MGGLKRVFLDANILFSATTPGGLIRRLVVWIIHHAEGVTNDYALGEARKNLSKRKPDRLGDLELLSKELHIINHTVPPPEIELRAKDIPILVGAIASKCTHLLTQDERDFGPYFGHKIQGVLITHSDLFFAEIGQSKYLNVVADKATTQEEYLRILSKVPNNPPDPGDEW